MTGVRVCLSWSSIAVAPLDRPRSTKTSWESPANSINYRLRRHRFLRETVLTPVPLGSAAGTYVSCSIQHTKSLTAASRFTSR